MPTYIVVDVESDGPIIGHHSMICFGAVVLDHNGLKKTFYGECCPANNSLYDPKALAVSGFTRDQTLRFKDRESTMREFADWIDEHKKGGVVLLSDNNGYDASWINYYFQITIGSNPFGWSSRRIGDMFAGFYNNPYFRWKKFRKTKHTHHPVDDAKGNAEAVLYLIKQGFKMKL